LAPERLFAKFSAKKLSFFLKPIFVIHFLQNSAVSRVIKPFSPIFWRKSFLNHNIGPCMCVWAQSEASIDPVWCFYWSRDLCFLVKPVDSNYLLFFCANIQAASLHNSLKRKIDVNHTSDPIKIMQNIIYNEFCQQNSNNSI
jgi:hypothetical protein